MAAAVALKFALDIGISKAILEGDSKVINYLLLVLSMYSVQVILLSQPY